MTLYRANNNNNKNRYLVRYNNNNNSNYLNKSKTQKVTNGCCLKWQ